MYSRSTSFHQLYHRFRTNNISNVLDEIKRQMPYIRPCYAVSKYSSPNTLSLIRDKKIDMICYDSNPNVIKVNGEEHSNEYIVRNISEIKTSSYVDRGSPTLWIKTTISNDGIEQTREMFEYIWAHKHILNGIVFDIRNFSNGYIPPTMYSYKIAIDYLFRNIVIPFEREYGIQTPAIIIDAKDNITHMRQLYELHSYALNETSVINVFRKNKPELRLVLGALFDSASESITTYPRRSLSFHEYP